MVYEATLASKTGTFDKKGVVVIEDMNSAHITRENIRIAFVFQLPFRLRTAKFAKLLMDHETIEEIVLYNPMAFPDGSDFNQICKDNRGDYRSLWSTAIALANGKTLTDQELEVLKDGQLLASRLDHDVRASVLKPVFEFKRLVTECIESVNALIVASTWLAIKRSGPNGMYGVTPIRTLSEFDLPILLRSQIVVICPETFEITEETIVAILDAGCRNFEVKWVEPLRSDSYDIANIQLEEWNRVLGETKTDVILDFSFEALSYATKGQYQIALLMAVVSMEAAHSSFVRAVLKKRLPGKENEKSSAINNLLREQGIYALCQVTPYLMMEEEDRPAEAHVKMALKAIQMRNAVMHATQKKGAPKLRGFKKEEYIEAYTAAVIVRDTYLRARDKLLSADENISGA